MRFTTSLTRLIAGAAMAGLLAACSGGGGGGSSIVPTNNNGSNPTNPGATTNAKASTTFKVFVPASTVGGSSSSTKRPNYIASTGTSSLVVSVQPADPAEAAQWATLYGASGFTVCYNIFTNGAIASPLAPGVTVTPIVGPPAGYNVSFPFPSPPGQDTYTISQYAGACSSTNPYAPPTPGPGQTAANLILAQGVPYTVNIVAGATNNFNVQLSACNTPPGPGPINQPAPVTCAVPNPAGTTTITPTLTGTISFVELAGSTPPLSITLPFTPVVPIQSPMREVGAFYTAPATGHVGFPIPVIMLDSNGNPIPYTAPVAPSTTPSSGLFPKAGDGVSITHTEVGSGGNHFALYLLDATTGAIMQNTEPITLTQANALNLADAKLGGAANVGHPYVVVATFDGSANALSTSATVSMVATINGTAQPTQTTTFSAQSALFTAVPTAQAPANGFADAAATTTAYTKAADILNLSATTLAAPNNGYWVTNGGSMNLVGTSAYAVAGAGTLTGEAYDNNANIAAPHILAVDNSVPGTALQNTIEAGGIYVFDPVAHTSKPLALEDVTSGEYFQLPNPQGIGYVSGGYVYAFAGNKIYVMDPVANGGVLTPDSTGNYFVAEVIGTLPVSGLSLGTGSGFDVVVSGTKLVFPNGTNIVSVDTLSCVPGGSSCTPTVVATSPGAAFVGLSANGTGWVATDSAGQIYTISSSGTVTSLGLTGGAVKDGVVGAIGTNPLAPVPYTTQGQTTNFFGTASVPTIPYNIAPFTAGGPVFAAPPAAALGINPDTSNATFGATAGTTSSGFGIQFITAAGTNTALTSNSYLFTDGGKLRTLVP
jgi:hypothetical protein